MDTVERDGAYIANTYARYGVVFARGKGARLWDTDGREYIDFSSGIGVNSLGIADREWLTAVTQQAGRLAHISNYFCNEPAAELAEMLCKRTGMERVFFANSGAEANECAIKAARKYSSQKYGAGRGVVVTLTNSFHGRTAATLSATGQEDMHTYFYPFPQGFVSVPANDLAALQAVFDNGDVCALMLECIQGEGGVIVLEKGYLKAAQKLCAQRDILFICDEVQTGNGRTGTLYAYEQFGLKPDIVTTAKGLGGGLPIGAVLFNKKTQGVFTPGTHGSTFGGNPLCCAAALSVLSRLDEYFLAAVRARGDFLRFELKKLPQVKELSGLGLMVGISVDGDAKQIAKACLNKGLVVLTAKDKIRLLPPLNIGMEELKEGVARLKEALEK
ncbi:MAG: aspartate aminotransferase family protein [Clostridium sp.]|jgi:acetylornithine/N-succinyldiaminopimelate aminotransferase|nr:aspartate aminotransferase family protein [Clostridium sp.]